MAIGEYELDSYMRLLRPAMPAGSALVIVDEHGLPVWIDETGDRERMWELLAHIGRDYWDECEAPFAGRVPGSV